MKLWRRVSGGVAGVAVLALSVLAIAPSVQASVEDFVFADFTADYYLSKDTEGRSTLKTTESLTAIFPTFNQNKGIIRVIPTSYDGHSVSLNFDDGSLTRNGQPEDVYDKSRSNGNLEVSTGNDDYVKGLQKYQYSYTQRDVTKDFKDHQELYWDTNGTEWRQPFESVVARVHLDPSIADAWTEDTSCYQGAKGSNEPCQVSVNDENGQTVITFESTRTLAVGENLTYVLGFKAGTFQAYKIGPTDIAQQYSPWIIMGLALFALAWTIFLKVTRGRNAPGRGTIIPQYVPLKNTSIVIADDLSGSGGRKVVAAQLIDLAVRGNLQIIEFEKPQLLFGPKKAYKVRFVNQDGMNEDELNFARVFFVALQPGDEYDMSDTKEGYKISMNMSVFKQRITQELIVRGLRRKVPGKFYPVILSALTLVGSFVFIMVTDGAGLSILPVMGAFFTMFFVIMISALPAPLTEQGAEIRDYVKGVKMYITVAEEDRLKMLQSVDGSLREEIGDPNDPAQLVKLYEKLLPYAVMLGLEKSWGKVLEQYYDPAVSPSWYVGTGAFSMGTFTSSISSFATSTSSSSSGLSGGGSSGGGGGGGGGGGR